MLQRIGQIAINAYDVDRATAFYRDVLGIKHLFSAPPKLSFFDIGGLWLMLAPPDTKELDHPSSLLYFDTDDILAEHARMEGLGVQFITKPHAVHRDQGRELWLADFRDSEGNTLVLRQWRNAA